MSKPAESKPVTVKILNRQYQINCPPDAEAELQQAAEYLHQKMTEIQAKARSINGEHAAVMAALNITHELFAEQGGKEAYVLEISEKIERLTHKLTETLSKRGIRRKEKEFSN